MPKNLRQGLHRSYVSLIAFACGLSVVFLLHTVAPAYAMAEITFNFSTSITGTAPFTPGDNGPGNDANGTNNIVRTLDQITYKWDYAVNNGSADNVVLTATLSTDQAWQDIPPACLTGSNVITNPDDTQTITCLLGNINSGSNGFIEAAARVVGQRPDNSFVGNGDIVTGIGTFNSDTSSSAQSDVVETIVSAKPKADLRKNRASRVVGLRTGRDGTTDGILVRYPLAILVAGGKGSEPLVGNILITDTLLGDFDNDGTAEAPVPGAELYNWGPNRGCAWNGEPGQSGLNEWYLPYGNLSRVPSQPERSVSDSGTWSCSQAGGPSTPITISIVGADTAGNHVPTQSRNGSSLPANETYLVSGLVEIWIPTQEILDNGGDLKLTNRYDTLDNLSVSGQVNQDPTTPGTNNDPDNNARTFTLVAGRGAFTQYYSTSLTNRAGVLFPMTTLNSGDGVVMPSQNFAKRIYGRNSGILDWEDYRYCEKFDNQVLRLEPIPGNPTTAVQEFNGGTAYTYVIEYGTGDENGNAGTYSSYTAMRRASCNDAESADGWYTDMNAVPIGTDAITKIRFRATQPLPPNATMDLAVNFVARNYYPGTTDQIPNGTLLPNMSAYSSPTLTASTNTNSVAGNGWYFGNYNPLTHGGTKAFGDRLFLTRAIVRINKETVPNDTVNSITVGQTVDYVLRSSVTATIDPAPTQPDVIIRDILPLELTYTNASANPPPTSVTNNPDGTTTIEWNLGARMPNQPIPDITFSATANFDVPNNTQVVNTAIVESPDDGSAESIRTAQRGIVVGNAAAFGIVKEVPQQLVEPESAFTYELKYANTGSIDVGVGDFIDILPYQNDGRSPNTSYSGTSEFVNITGAEGETFEYTLAPPATVRLDPQDASNQTGSGSTVWCPSFSGGSCPATAAEVTAIRIFTPAFPEGEPTRTIVVTLSATGNTPDDVYTNVFGGRVVGLIGALESNAVPVTIRYRSSLVLVKRITAINDQPLTALVNDPNDNNDDDPNWPNGYLQGEIYSNIFAPRDDIEYTVYFLSNGISDVYNLNVCDLVPENTTFSGPAYAGLMPMENNGLSASRLGIALSTSPGGLRYLTIDNDSDSGSFFAPGLTPSADCLGTNTNGAVVVTVPQLSHTGPGGSPQSAYGFIRFKTKIQ